MSLTQTLPSQNAIRAQLEASPAHSWTCQRWAAWLWWHWPDEYADPIGLPRKTTARPGSPGKVAVLVSRAERSVALWHPRDVLLCDAVGETAARGRNGAVLSLRSQVLRSVQGGDGRHDPEEETAEADEAASAPLPAGMVAALERQGIRVGDPEIQPCTECGWRYRRLRGGSPVCSWCGAWAM